ncbi:hypothetical protein GCK72_012860 [Caenorhabditis remanei]|uniref:Uncharacterized protein n=1 Tax=Caenorhabditis remanei TaxID=31234 RepID=A0A6A5GM91_CAERE|nr:hypothetical protein GCK72_012860 [Caenorhabditis remanei]KAF1756407.1 hypothetical protein GCK72_012860 [Caenorhabditis remanei]
MKDIITAALPKSAQKEKSNRDGLEEHGGYSSHLLLLLDEDLEVLVDDRDSEKDSSSRSNSSHEVSCDGKCSDTETSESGGSWNVSVQLVDHRLLTMTAHDHLLFLQLLGNILSGRSRHIDPGFGEECARSEHEDNVDNAVEWVFEDVSEVIGPGTEKVDEEVSSELSGEHLKSMIQSGLKNDWDVGSVEKLDWVAAVLSTVAGRLDWKVDTESLEVDNHSENEESGHQVHQVWKVLTVESLTESADLIGASGEKMEESDDSSLEFSSTSGVHCGWRERLPDNRFANVGGDEERDSGSETISFLEKLVEKKDDETGNHELDDDEKADSSSDFRWLSVESGHDVDNSLSNGDDHSEH